MYKLAIMNLNLGRIEIVNMTDETYNEYTDNLEELIYGKFNYSQDNIYYLIDKRKALPATALRTGLPVSNKKKYFVI